MKKEDEAHLAKISGERLKLPKEGPIPKRSPRAPKPLSQKMEPNKKHLDQLWDQRQKYPYKKVQVDV